MLSAVSRRYIGWTGPERMTEKDARRDDDFAGILLSAGFLNHGLWPSSFLLFMHQNVHCILKVRVERKGYVNQVETETIQHA